MFSSNLFCNFFFCNAVDDSYVFTGLSIFFLAQHDISSSFDYLQNFVPSNNSLQFAAGHGSTLMQVVDHNAAISRSLNCYNSFKHPCWSDGFLCYQDHLD